MPLLKKDGLPEKAREVLNLLELNHNVQYTRRTPSAAATAGKMPSEPLCITVDHDSLTDNAVTIRDRDTMAQERVAIADLAARVEEK